MIPKQLERLILKGLAEYRVFNQAFGSFGTIPLPPMQTAIITNIIWYPFLNPIKPILDGPIIPGTPAVGSIDLSFEGPIGPPPTFLSNLNIPGPNIIAVTWDIVNPANTQANIQAGLDAIFGPGTWLCSFTIVTPGVDVFWSITTSTPGTAYNGEVMTIDTIPADFSQGPAPFSGGSQGTVIADFLTYGDLFNYNEYQLKIDGKKTKNYYHFRNEMDFQWFNGLINNEILFGTPGVSLTDLVDNTTLSKNFLLKNQRPTQINTYLVCEEYIKLTVTRNALVETMVNTMGLVNNRADEKNSPNGIANKNVLLNSNMQGGLIQQDYQPPQKINTGAPSGDRLKENYVQDISFNNASMLTEPQGIINLNPALPNLSPYVTHPLITIGVVLVNKNGFDELQNN